MLWQQCRENSEAIQHNCQETLREKRNMHLITSWTCTHIDIIRQYTIVYLINYETVDKTWQDVEMLLREGSAILNEYCFIKFISDIDARVKNTYTIRTNDDQNIVNDWQQ
jgi:hypothetical protein